MGDEIPFRIGLVALSALAPFIQVYFGRKARPHQGAYTSVKRDSFRREGRLNFVVHAALVFAMGIVVALYAAYPPSVAWSHVAIPDAWRWAGLGFGIVSLLALIKVHRQLGRFWSAYLELQEGHQLITTGVYRRIRHPMYSVLFFFLLAAAVMSANWLFMVLCAGRMLMFFERIRREEGMLIGQFGDEYRRYQQRTGRLLPRLRAG
ncbi:MAG TPA: isoprenylcysteine carboxylmethyltransferase family protein [Terriglobia bacterium]|nr:isoprenylcysteine carboxylmethyltransferase family protein [Terriglobia bacterium]